MSVQRMFLVFVVMLVAGMMGLGAASAAVIDQDLQVVPLPNGTINLMLTASRTNAGVLYVDVYRKNASVPAVTPAPGDFSPSDLVAQNVLISSGVEAVISNVSDDTQNQANGFNFGTQTNSEQGYHYYLVVKESGTSNVGTVVRGAVADANAPQVLTSGQFTQDVDDGSAAVGLNFVNPGDQVLDPYYSGSVLKQIAVPPEDYRFQYQIYRIIGSQSFDLDNGSVPANLDSQIEITPVYTPGVVTSYTDNPPAASALAYGLRILDTVGNINGGAPLSANQAGQVVTPVTDLAASQVVVGDYPVTQLDFTVNIASLISDPANANPAKVYVYARQGVDPITSADLGTATLVETFSRSTGTALDSFTFDHSTTTAALPRVAGNTYAYAVVIETDNGQRSPVSNSVTQEATDFIPPSLLELQTPADNSYVHGTVFFSANAQDDIYAGSGIDAVTFTLNTTVIGVDNTDTVGTGVGSYSLSYDTTLIPDGTYTYSAECIDFGGNTLMTGSGDPGAGPNFTILVDNTAPDIVIDSPVAGTPVNGSFVIRGTAGDANADIVSVNITYSTTSGFDSATVAGLENWSAVIPVDAAFADGDNLTVNIEVTDSHGLVTTTSRAFCVDNVCGSLVLNSPVVAFATAYVGNNSFTISGQAWDDGLGGACDAGIQEIRFIAVSTGITQIWTPATVPATGTVSFGDTFTYGDFGLVDGDSTLINVEMIDGATGVPNQCGPNFTLIVDLDGGSCSIDAPADGTCFSYGNTILGASDIIVSATASGSDLAVVGYTIFNSQNTPVASATTTVSGSADIAVFSFDFMSLATGDYRLETSVTDVLGNLTSSCSSINFSINSSQTYSWIDTPTEAYVNGSFLVTGRTENYDADLTPLGPVDVSDVWVAYPAPGSTAVPSTPSVNPDWQSVAYVVGGATQQAIEVDFDLGFRFPFYGACHQSVYVTSQGYLYFNGAGSFPHSDMNDTDPKVAGFWRELEAANTYYRQYEDRFQVQYRDVLLYGASTDSVSMTITLHESGVVDVDYGTVSPMSAVVGLSAGVSGHPLSGMAVNSNGIPRLSTTLSGLSGYPTMIEVGDMAVFEEMANSSGLTDSMLRFQGTTQWVNPIATANGWTANLPVDATFTGNGDPFPVCVNGLGGCNLDTWGQSANSVYGIDRTGPASTVIVDASTGGNCPGAVASPAIVYATVNDAGCPDYRLASGICSASIGVYQSGSLLGYLPQTSLYVGGNFLSDYLPHASGPLSFYGSFDPASYGINSGEYFGVSVVANDCATSVVNASSTYSVVPDDYLFDSEPPVCSIVTPASGACFTYANTDLGYADIMIDATDEAGCLANILVTIYDASPSVVAEYALIVSGATASYVDSYNFMALDEGEYTLTVQVTDEAGNSAVCSTAAFRVNKTGPVTTIANSPEVAVNGSLHISGTSVDPLTGIPADSAVVWYPGMGPSLPAPLSATEIAAAPMVAVDYLPPVTAANVIAHVTFTNGFRFPFYGQCWDKVEVSNHGVLLFGSNGYVPSANPVTDVDPVEPKIMPLWGSIDGRSGGGTWYQQFDDRARIIFNSVTSVGSSDVNDVTVTLYANGAVEFEYGQLDVLSTVPGNNLGVGLTAGPLAHVLSTTGSTGLFPFSLGASRALRVLSATQVNVVDDMSYHDIFIGASAYIGSGSRIAFTSTSVTETLVVDAGGQWSATIPVAATFCGNYDPWAFTVAGFGGCYGNTMGACNGLVLAIDRTAPNGEFDNPTGNPYQIVNGPFVLSGTMTDRATDGFLGLGTSSGVCQAVVEVVQNGVVVHTYMASELNGLETQAPLVIPFDIASVTTEVDPSAIGLQPGWFGFNMSLVDCATDTANTWEMYSSVVPESYYYDPVAPLSQVVCTRLFISGYLFEEGPNDGGWIYELNPDTGDVINVMQLPSEWVGFSNEAGLAFNGSELFLADLASASGATSIAVLDPDTGALLRTLPIPVGVTEIDGLGVEGSVLNIMPQPGSTLVVSISTIDGTLLGTSDIADAGYGGIGSGIFGRTIMSSTTVGQPLGQQQILEQLPNSNTVLTTVMALNGGAEVLGIGFSGTRLFTYNNEFGGVLYEFRTDASLAPINVMTPPGSWVMQFNGVAAGPRGNECRLCTNAIPARICTAASDIAPLGFSQIDLFAFPAGTDPALAWLLGSATTTDNQMQSRSVADQISTDAGSAAVACATLTAASASMMFPGGEGRIVVYSQATDAAGNTEVLADALTRSVTFSLDTRAPRVLAMHASPVAATSGYDGDVTLTVLFQEQGSGLNVTSSSPVVTAMFSSLVGGTDIALSPMTIAATDSLGFVTGTVTFNPSLLSLPDTSSAFIDFVVSATDYCGNATDVTMASRLIIDNLMPLPDDMNPYYPVYDIFANGYDGGLLWSMTNSSVWTLNEMNNPYMWDSALWNVFANAQAMLANVLAGNSTYLLSPTAHVGDVTTTDHMAASGVASVRLYMATGPEDATPALSEFTTLIGELLGLVQLQVGPDGEVMVASTVGTATALWSWDPSTLTPTQTGSSDFVYLKLVVTDYAGNTLDPIFGPFSVIDLIAPDRVVVTAEMLPLTHQVRLDWEWIAQDNVETVGYEIWRSKFPVEDVLAVSVPGDFDVMARIDARYDDGQPVTEYLVENVPDGVYAYYVVAYDEAGNGLTGPGGTGIPGNRSNVVAVARDDRQNPYPITNLRVRAGEPDDGIILTWDIPSTPLGGGLSNPIGDNVGIAVWEIFRRDGDAGITQALISKPDNSIQRNPDLLLATVVNQLIPDYTTPTGGLRPAPTKVVGERATINTVSPELVVVLMPPFNASSVSRVYNETTGETYMVVSVNEETIEIAGSALPQEGDVVKVDYLTARKTFVDNTVVPEQSYSYAIVGRDAAGNRASISTSVQPGDPITMAIGTTPPSRINTLHANRIEASTIELLWDINDFANDRSPVAGFIAEKQTGSHNFIIPGDSRNVMLEKAMFGPVYLAPTASSVTIELATADVEVDVDLLNRYGVMDITRMEMIPSIDKVSDPINETHFVLAGRMLTINNIPQTQLDPQPVNGSIYNNIRVVCFDDELSLFKEVPDATDEISFVSKSRIQDGNSPIDEIVTYIVRAADPWGNVSVPSNSVKSSNEIITINPPVDVVVHNNAVGAACWRTAATDTLTALVGSDAHSLEVYSDLALTNRIAMTPVTPGSVATVGPIPLRSFANLSGPSDVYVVARSQYGIPSLPVQASVDIEAPEISMMEVEPQVPYQPGSPVRLEDTLDLMLEYPENDRMEDVWVQVFTESPLAIDDTYLWVDASDYGVFKNMAAAADGTTYAVAWSDQEDDKLPNDYLLMGDIATETIDLVTSSLTSPTAIAIADYGQGDIWVAGRNPANPNQAQFIAMSPAGDVLKTINTTVAAPVVGMVAGLGNSLWFVTESSSDLRSLDTVTNTLSVVATDVVEFSRGIGWDGGDLVYLSDVEDVNDPFSGRIREFDLTTMTARTIARSLQNIGGVAVDRLGGVHYVEIVSGIMFPRFVLSEVRLQTNGDYTQPVQVSGGIFSTTDSMPIVGPVIDRAGNILMVDSYWGEVTAFEGNRRSGLLPEPDAINGVPLTAKVLGCAQMSQWSPFGLGDNQAHEVQAVAVDRAGNYSQYIASAFNDVAPPLVVDSVVNARPRGEQDLLFVLTEPGVWVMAYSKEQLVANNLINQAQANAWGLVEMTIGDDEYTDIWIVGVDAYGNRSRATHLTNEIWEQPEPVDLSKVVVTQRGRSYGDSIRGTRGAVGNGSQDLWLFAYSDESLTEVLDGFPVYVDAREFNSSPAPGAFGETSIGDNYAQNGLTWSDVVGNPTIWLTVQNFVGDESDPVRIDLDVEVSNPDVSKIFVYADNPQVEAFVEGMNRAVEGNSRVLVTADSSGLGVYGAIWSDVNGGWEPYSVGPLMRQPDVVPHEIPYPEFRGQIYVRAIDSAGNRSALVPVQVEIVPYAVLDSFGSISLRSGLVSFADGVSTNLVPDGVARAIEPGYYRANSVVSGTSTVSVPDFNSAPTGFYRMTGYGQVEAFGDVLPVDVGNFAPFSQDLAKDIAIAPVQAGTSVAFYMLDGYGNIHNFGPVMTQLTGTALGKDIARDMELDLAADGTVRGGFLLDGHGGLFNLGSSTPFSPAGAYYADQDVFVDVELVYEPGNEFPIAALKLTNNGQISVAGSVNRLLLRGLPTFGFDIARDLEISYNTETGEMRGVYLLDGYGGIHATGIAPTIHDVPYFGFDIARDLELFRYWINSQE